MHEGLYASIGVYVSVYLTVRKTLALNSYGVRLLELHPGMAATQSLINAPCVKYSV